MSQPKPPRVSDVNITVKVTLKEFFCGAIKVVNYNRQVVGLDGRTVKYEDAIVEVVVKRGMLESAQLYFPGKGNQQPKMPATDLIVSFVQSSKDKYYSRKTSDLMFKHKVSLSDVITCAPVRLTSLDGRIMNIPVDSMMSTGDVMKVDG